MMLSRLPISLSNNIIPDPATPQTVRNVLREHNFCTVIKKNALSQKGPSFGASQNLLNTMKKKRTGRLEEGHVVR